MPLILGTNSIKDTGYEVANSCRWDDGSSPYMHKTPGGAGNSKTFTFSAWLKIGTDDFPDTTIFSNYTDSNNFFKVYIQGDYNQFGFYNKTGGSVNTTLLTSMYLRDVTAWYHVCVTVDTTQGTDTDRVKIYINGKLASLSTTTYPSQNTDLEVNEARRHDVGAWSNSQFFDGYMAEVCFIDGSALAASSFGEFDEDSPQIWKPKDVSGLTFGTNGFYLDFEDSSNLGNDANGGTDLTEVNLAAIDQTTDTPTNNFATWNPLDNYYAASSFSNANTTVTTGFSANNANVSTIGVSTGKWYAEIKVVAKTSGINDDYLIGIIGGEYTANNQNLGNNTESYAYYAYSGASRTNNSQTSYGDTYTAGDIIGVLLNLDDNELKFSKNGTVQNSGTAISITAASSQPLGVYFIAAGIWQNGGISTHDANFGNPPFSISSGNADANGYGNFEYAVPSGYYALCTKNLAEYG